jgi:hypothetical protein
MKHALLIPILPKVLHRIANGKQAVLFTRQTPGRQFTRVLLALRDPEPLVVCEAICDAPMAGGTGWLHTHYYRLSGMSPAEWRTYFVDCTKGAALCISDYAVVPEAKRFDPVPFWRLSQFPQKFCYVPAPPWALGHPITKPEPKTGDLF